MALNNKIKRKIVRCTYDEATDKHEIIIDMGENVFYRIKGVLEGFTWPGMPQDRLNRNNLEIMLHFTGDLRRVERVIVKEEYRDIE